MGYELGSNAQFNQLWASFWTCQKKEALAWSIQHFTVKINFRVREISWDILVLEENDIFSGTYL